MTSRIRIATALACVGLALPSPSATAGEEREIELARELMSLTGEDDAGVTAAAGIISQMKPSFPTVSDEEWAEVARTFSSEEMIEMSVTVYVKHFDESELSQLVDFYRSSLGQKLLQRTPAVLNEIAVIGNQWAQAKMQQISKKLQAAGHPLRNR